MTGPWFGNPSPGSAAPPPPTFPCRAARSRAHRSAWGRPPECRAGEQLHVSKKVFLSRARAGLPQISACRAPGSWTAPLCSSWRASPAPVPRGSHPLLMHRINDHGRTFVGLPRITCVQNAMDLRD
ncbi:hypothetical protein NDU88_003560 [Pleurodeles waltl]|uniref:Uncharacterized protein n=1 Tax=Pleurodeles waltl TaxID=8319 RepID=A0AAV7TRG9_PLEWA|nr:hypothetical protein NDU88_003560 [Pleurodeles waltl]